MNHLSVRFNLVKVDAIDQNSSQEPLILIILRVSIRYRVRTVEYFKFPNIEGATVWEKLINMGAKRK